MPSPSVREVTVALAFLRSKHDYRTLTLDAELVRQVIHRATKRAAQGDDVVDERLRGMHELHNNTIKGVEALFTKEELERGREMYGDSNQSWLGWLRCVMKVVRGGAPDETAEDLKGDIEYLEREVRTLKAEKDRYREALREVATGRADGADVAQAALGGGEFVGRIERPADLSHLLEREWVWCHGCGDNHQLDTYDALNHGVWPECCGRPMRIDPPDEAAENSL
jgi:hypothetical protein